MTAWSFDSKNTEGFYPHSGLTLGTDGNFYGRLTRANRPWCRTMWLIIVDETRPYNSAQNPLTLTDT